MNRNQYSRKSTPLWRLPTKGLEVLFKQGPRGLLMSARDYLRWFRRNNRRLEVANTSIESPDSNGEHRAGSLVQRQGHAHLPESDCDTLAGLAPKDFSQRFADIPPHLVGKVNGSLLESDFVAIGQYIAGVIGECVGDLTQTKMVLDFGCGLGRILSQLVGQIPNASFVAYDIDPMMLDWCKHLLGKPNCQFVSSTIDVVDDSFDLIYAVSVFTHLDSTTDYWLKELHRLLASNGKAFLTYHDETLFAEVAGTLACPNAPSGAILHERHVVGADTSEGGSGMGTFYTTDYWHQLLERYFNVECSVRRGLFGHQSYTVVTKKPVAIEHTASDRQYIRSLEQELFALRRKYQIMF